MNHPSPCLFTLTYLVLTPKQHWWLWPTFLDSEWSLAPFFWATFCAGLLCSRGDARVPPLAPARMPQRRTGNQLCPMAKWCFHHLKAVRWIQETWQSHFSPTYIPASSKPPTLFVERDFLSRLLIPVYLFIFFPSNHGSRICCCSKTHFIFIFTVSVLIARPASIRLRIPLSCTWANK